MNRIPILHATFFILSVATLLTSGCATLVKGSSQGVTVKTEPPGAICELSKKGKTIGIVNPTPGTIGPPQKAIASQASLRLFGRGSCWTYAP